MAVETEVAPAPAGVETHEKPDLGPVPQKTSVGDKFRAEFDKLTKPASEIIPPKPPPSESPPTTPEVKPPVEETKEPSKTEEVKPVDKPASPLDAVLATDKKEPEKVEEPDVLKEFSEDKPDWKRARGVMKTQSEKIRELEAKVSAPAPKTDTTVVESVIKERDELKAALQDRENAIKAINAEYSGEYQELVKARENVLGKIETRTKSYGGDADGLLAALSMPHSRSRNEQIKAAMVEIDSEDKPRIHALIETLENHDEKIADFRKDLPAKWDDIQAKREVQLRENYEKQLKTLEVEFGKVADELPTESVTFRQVPDDVPGAKEWNQEIQEAIQKGLNVLKPDGADFRQSAIVAAKGVRYDALEKRYLSLHTDHVELKKQYAELAGSGPDFKGGSQPTVKTDKKPGVKYREALAAAQGAGVGEV